MDVVFLLFRIVYILLFFSKRIEEKIIALGKIYICTIIGFGNIIIGWKYYNWIWKYYRFIMTQKASLTGSRIIRSLILLFYQTEYGAYEIW